MREDISQKKVAAALGKKFILSLDEFVEWGGLFCLVQRLSIPSLVTYLYPIYPKNDNITSITLKLLHRPRDEPPCLIWGLFPIDIHFGTNLPYYTCPYYFDIDRDFTTSSRDVISSNMIIINYNILYNNEKI